MGIYLELIGLASIGKELRLRANDGFVNFELLAITAAQRDIGKLSRLEKTKMASE